MSVIEGVGDEVTVVGIFLLVLIIVWAVNFISNGTHTPSISSSSEIQNESTQQSPVEETQETFSHENQSQNCNTEVKSSEPLEDSSKVDSTDVVEETDTITSHIETIVVNEEHLSSSSSPEPCNQNLAAPSAPDISTSDDNDTNTRPETQPGQIRVRLKYLDDTDRTVTSHLTEKIGDFKRNNFPEEVASNKIVRLIYNGQLLKDNFEIGFYGILDSHVVHVHVSQARAPQDIPAASQNPDLDVSHLLWPLLSVILGIFWVLYFKYPEFFSVMSISILVLFTGSFIFVYSRVQQR